MAYPGSYSSYGNNKGASSTMLKFISYVMIFVLGFAACATILHRHAPQMNLLGGGSVASIPAPAPTSGEEGTGAGPGTTIYAVAKVEPSVVNIDITEKAVATPRDSGPFSMPTPFGGQQDESPQSQARTGQASGVIISSVATS
ncbi:MAG: hypothetical protein M3Y56_08970 [Armatimonadota bacterium]|nr:hypothetical protein [Armatimonadota bacterium]